MLTDIRLALRTLSRATGFSLPAVLSLALGISASAANSAPSPRSERRVTAADVKAFAQKYLVPGNRTVVRLLPESK